MFVGLVWSPKHNLKKATISFAYSAKAFETININNSIIYFRLTSLGPSAPQLPAHPYAKQHLKKNGRFLCFSILIESI